MNPTFWGPGLWTYIHSVAAVAYTPQQRKDFVSLVNVLARTLPCNKCKNHFRQNMRSIPISNYMKDNETLFMWTYLMHDAVTKAQNDAIRKSGSEELPKYRPTWKEIYMNYFDVGDDEGLDFEGDYQNSICKEVCSETSIEYESDKKEPQKIKIRESNSKFSNMTRKYKSRN